MADLTGTPAILGHRVVTLHPKVHGGLLADPDDPTHVADMEAHGIEPIDLVVVNLYPFADQPGIEMIDVGGPAMVRAAAKNHAHVGVVVDPARLRAGARGAGGRAASCRPPTRRRLARKAFADHRRLRRRRRGVARRRRRGRRGGGDPLPATLHLALEKAQELRYGENPHQHGARYRRVGERSWWDDAVQLGGKELSYLNLFDAEAAWRLVHRFDEPAAVIVKHANPCGVAVGRRHHRRLPAGPRLRSRSRPSVASSPSTGRCPSRWPRRWRRCSPRSWWRRRSTTRRWPCSAAKKNLRLLAAPPPGIEPLDVRTIDGGLLVQEPDRVSLDRRAVAGRHQGGADADRVGRPRRWRGRCARRCRRTPSCSSRTARPSGSAPGQQNRLDSARIAAERAAGRAAGGACASDAFFPFRDGLDAAVGRRASRAVVQPGGSVRDGEVIEAADEHGIAMVFTGERHFRH